ncbi:MAG: DUF4282 domain-containing protein [Sulfurovum sp.]|nr:DUF4282 domain-containing protein [Sulfurovum sp.]
MIDFLTFKTFITPSLLVLMYVMGAVVIPFVSYYVGKWLLTRYFSKQKEQFYAVTTIKQRIWLLMLFVGCFVCMEIMWRVMMEFFVAYFDMHEALMKLSA